MAGNIKEIDDNSFSNTISKGVTLVDFSAEWCGPCKAMGPILEDVAKEVGDKASVTKIDIDRNQKTTSDFNIMSVPTMILFKNGKEVHRIVGLKDAKSLVQLINSNL